MLLLSWNQTNTKWGRKVFLQLGRICFRILLRQSKNFSDFCKVLSQFAFRNMIVPLPKSQTRHPARAQAPLPLPHKFFDVKSFYKIPPILPIIIAKSRQNAFDISSRHVVFVRRLGDFVNAKNLPTGGGVCKVLLCQKSMCGRWRGAWARAGWRVWDLGNGTIMLRKANRDKTLQKLLNSPTVAKIFENKFGQVVEKPSDLILCLFGFMKAAKFRDSSEYSRCVQNVLTKSCLPCQILYKPKKFFLSAERPRYEFSATGLRRIVSSGFPGKFA